MNKGKTARCIVKKCIFAIWLIQYWLRSYAYYVLHVLLFLHSYYALHLSFHLLDLLSNQCVST